MTKLTLGLLGVFTVSTALTQSSAQAAPAPNGFAMNGFTMNGFTMNGLGHNRLLLGRPVFESRTAIRNVSGIDSSRPLNAIARH